MRAGRVVTPQRYRTVACWALAGQVGIVVTGALVRLTGSGLGCSDWPGCESDRFVPAWSFHDWVEYGNRLLTFVVAATAAVAVLGARWRRPYRADLFRLALVLVAGVVAQAVLGALVVIFELDPRLTIGHFLLSIVLVTDAVVLLHRAEPSPPQAAPVVITSPGGPHGWYIATHLLLVAALTVVVSGTIVTASGPHGGDERAARLGFDLSTVTQVHTGATWVFVAVLGVTAGLLWWGGAGPSLKGPVTFLATATGTQGVIGYVQYGLGVPAGLVALHVVGSLVVWVTALLTLLRTRSAVARRRGAATEDPPAHQRAEHVPVLSKG